VGAGPRSGQPTENVDRQWYALFGLVRLGKVDSQQLAHGAKDYRVRTEFTFTDILISTFTSFLSFYRQSVIVEQ
jgi:hypothetical protein